MTVTDLNGTGLTSAEKCFTITVNQIINNPPSFTLHSPAVYTADASDGKVNVAGWVVEALDGEGGKQLPFNGSDTTDKICFNITSNSNPSLFTGLPYISFPSQALHFETKAGTSGSAEVCTVAVDRNGSGLTSPEQCFTINITDSLAVSGNSGAESGSDNSSEASDSGSESGPESTSGGSSSSSESGVDSSSQQNGSNSGDNLSSNNSSSNEATTSTKGAGGFSTWLIALLTGLGLFRRRK